MTGSQAKWKWLAVFLLMFRRLWRATPARRQDWHLTPLKMKKLIKLSAVALFGVALLAPFARAITINAYVDAAPNAFGSPDFAPWWTAAKIDAVNGTFVNMAHSVDPANQGTLQFNIRDTFVYSFGDLGKRLHFIYWIPGETTDSLTAQHFQIGIDLVWDGVTYPTWAYGDEWVTPLSWENYDGGVIGSGGVAFWGAYGINTQAALEADIAAYQPYTDGFNFRVRADNIEPTTLISVTQRVPEAAATLLLVVLGLGALVAWRRRGR